MHITTQVPIIIKRRPAEVFAALTHFDTWLQWGGGNLVSMEQISTSPLQVGSQLRQVNKRGNKLTESFVEVTQFMQNQTLGIKSSVLNGTFTLEPVETGTRLNAAFELDATGLRSLMYRLFLNGFVMSDLRKFKALVEAS